ncbi:hypothetical protein A9Q77_09200 [Marinomonas sp. 42_23_T18]|nr:hypothetical protein A9Q77_09200 [Marinomonas sp. 42_23_T18]
MMIIDLIDELDVIEGIHKQVPSLSLDENLAKEQNISQLLQAATKQAETEQWLQLNLWLTQITQDLSILLPEIKQALCSGWQGDRELTPELTHNLAL